MAGVLRAGALYCAIVFAAGFVLGTIRTLVLAPALGDVTAVVIELPFMLAVAWIAWGFVLRTVPVAPRTATRAATGAVAFILLIAAEFLLARALGQTGGAFLAAFGTPAGALGLAGQVVFALFPLVRR
jgi:hypothetical protein